MRKVTIMCVTEVRTSMKWIKNATSRKGTEKKIGLKKPLLESQPKNTGPLKNEKIIKSNCKEKIVKIK